MCLPDEITETIWAHHRDICRFVDEMDIGYQRVLRRIIEFVADASGGSSRRSGSLLLSDTGERLSGGETERRIEDVEAEGVHEEVDLVDIGEGSLGGMELLILKMHLYLET